MTRTTLATLATLGAAALAAASCSQEPPLSATSVYGSVEGRLLSLDGEPLGQTVVSADGIETVTDAEGRFSFQALGLGRTLITAAPAGFSQAHVPVDVIGEATQTRDLVVLPVRTQTLDPAALIAGLRVTGDQGLGLTFAPGTRFVTAMGQQAVGPLTLHTATFASRDRIVAAPGGLEATTPDGVVPLESFGMASVEVLDAEGRIVQPNRFVGVEFPMAPTTAFEDGESVPLWHYDEDAGYWVQEGEAARRGDVFVATVPHFSVWNIDVPYDTTCIDVEIGTPGGEPVPPGGGIVLDGIDYWGSNTSYVGQDGTVRLMGQLGGRANLRLAAAGSYSLEADVDLPSVSWGNDNGNCVDIGQVTVMDLTGDEDGDGYSPLEGDCDDLDPLRNPAGIETCESTEDMNCDGAMGGLDADNDGYGVCVECNDSHADVHPGAPDLCDGILDNDCDGATDTRELDIDGDGLTWCTGDCDDLVEGSQCPQVDLSARSIALAQEYSCAKDGLDWRCWGAVPEVDDGWQTAADLGAGHDGFCALTPEGRVECHTERRDPVDVFAGAPSPPYIRSLDQFRHAVCASDGPRIWCWQHDKEGPTAPTLQLTPPDTEWVRVVVEIGRWCALGVDGRIGCGELDGEYSAVAAPEAAVDVAVSRFWVSWITPAGVVRHRDAEANGGASTPISDGPYHDVVLGRTLGCGLAADGHADCFATDGWGSVPQPSPAARFTELDVGDDHACGRMTDGSVRCWGDGDFGRTEVPEGL